MCRIGTCYCHYITQICWCGCDCGTIDGNRDIASITYNWCCSAYCYLWGRFYCHSYILRRTIAASVKLWGNRIGNYYRYITAVGQSSIDSEWQVCLQHGKICRGCSTQMCRIGTCYCHYITQICWCGCDCGTIDGNRDIASITYNWCCSAYCCLWGRFYCHSYILRRTIAASVKLWGNRIGNYYRYITAVGQSSIDSEWQVCI